MKTLGKPLLLRGFWTLQLSWPCRGSRCKWLMRVQAWMCLRLMLACVKLSAWLWHHCALQAFETWSLFGVLAIWWKKSVWWSCKTWILLCWLCFHHESVGKDWKIVLMMWSINKFIGEHNCLLLSPLCLSKSVYANHSAQFIHTYGLGLTVTPVPARGNASQIPSSPLATGPITVPRPSAHKPETTSTNFTPLNLQLKQA